MRKDDDDDGLNPGDEGLAFDDELERCMSRERERGRSVVVGVSVHSCTTFGFDSVVRSSRSTSMASVPFCFGFLSPRSQAMSTVGSFDFALSCGYISLSLFCLVGGDGAIYRVSDLLLSFCCSVRGRLSYILLVVP